MAPATAWASELRRAAALEVLLGAAKAWASELRWAAALEVLLGVELDSETLGEASAAEPAAALAQESGGKSAEASVLESGREWAHPGLRRRRPSPIPCRRRRLRRQRPRQCHR